MFILSRCCLWCSCKAIGQLRLLYLCAGHICNIKCCAQSCNPPKHYSNLCLHTLDTTYIKSTSCWLLNVMILCDDFDYNDFTSQIVSSSLFILCALMTVTQKNSWNKHSWNENTIIDGSYYVRVLYIAHHKWLIESFESSISSGYQKPEEQP